MTKLKALPFIAAIGIAATGISLQATVDHKSNLILSNLDALNDSIDTFECPTLYDIPHASLELFSEIHKVTCTNEKAISVFGYTLPGKYIVGNTYSVSISGLKCIEGKKNVCCNPEKQYASVEVL